MYQEEYKRWLEADLQDADLNPELSKIEGNDNMHLIQDLLPHTKSPKNPDLHYILLKYNFVQYNS